MSGSQTLIINSSLIGQTISYLSKNTNDQVAWEGKLEGLVTAAIAQNFSDVVSYNSAVRLSDPTVSTDLTVLNFFIITLANNTGPVQRYAFAEEWILAGSLSVVSQQVAVSVIVYDSPLSNHSQILTVLRAAGYSCYIPSI